MRINFPYYVETLKLPVAKALYPLFEAISNSVDAIEESKLENGLIAITLERSSQGLLVDEGEENRELLPIQNITIEDNGIGFRDLNFNAFSELNTVWKKTRGGRGVGRVVWLKVFDYAEIESVYANGGKEYRRFNFKCEEEPIELIEQRRTDNNDAIMTSVRLVNCKSEYQEAIPKKRYTIAEEIVTHFLPYFMVGHVPVMVLKEDGLEDIDLLSVFDSYIADKGERDSFEIAHHKFDVVHTKAKYHSQRNREHRVFYVAGGRVVETRAISSERIGHLPPKIQIEDDEYIYVGYVESTFLDQNVNQSRYSFDIPQSTEGDTLFEQVDRRSIEENVNVSIEKYLEKYLEEAKQDKDEKIRRFINEKAPNYSYIYKFHKNLVDKIPYQSVDKGNTGQELARIHIRLREQFTEEAEEVLNIPDDQIKSTEEYKEKLNTLLEQMNPTGKADLAEYIIHRKTVLHLLEKVLKVRDDNKTQREDVIHNYVFPIRSSSDEITYNEHNLWLLDERLAYNTYIASDKPFGQIPGFENVDKEMRRKRADIYAYAYTTVEPNDTRSPFRSLDVFEFKRPMRDDYDNSENPYNQIEEYLEIIRQGRATTKDGRVLSVIDGEVIYCHAVCDFTPTLTSMLRREDFRQIGNEEWYIRFHQTFNALIEVRSFDLVLETATKRNQILFDKLGLK